MDGSADDSPLMAPQVRLLEGKFSRVSAEKAADGQAAAEALSRAEGRVAELESAGSAMRLSHAETQRQVRRCSSHYLIAINYDAPIARGDAAAGAPLQRPLLDCNQLRLSLIHI